MDLALFVTVLRHYKLLVAGGALFAAVLAIFAYGQPGLSEGKPTVTPRGAEIWRSQSQLLVSKNGFPYRSSSGQATRPSGTAPSFNDALTMASLAPIYAALANGDAVQAMLPASLDGKVTAAADRDSNTGQGQPFVTLTATAPSSSDAQTLAQQAAVILRSYVDRGQAAAGTPAQKRVKLAIVKKGDKAQLVKGHKLSLPVLVFVAVFAGTIFLAFALENLRSPRTAAQPVFLADGPARGSSTRIGAAPKSGARGSDGHE